MPREHILVVEDDEDARTMYSIMLRGWGYDVSEAATGRDAIHIARRHVPDLILLDIMMADIDGYSVCRELRSDPAFHRVPIIFLTALSGMDDRIRAYTMGADDFITKAAVNQQELKVRIRAALDRAARLRSAAETRGSGMIVGVMSLRGGVGVSTIAMNLARYATDADDRPVLLLDLSLPVGSTSLWSGITGPRHAISLLSRSPAEIDISLINNYSQQNVYGSYFIPGPPTIMDLSGVRIQALERTLTILREEGYIVILDMGRGTAPMMWHAHAHCRWLAIVTSADSTSRALANVALQSLPRHKVDPRALLLIYNDLTNTRPADVALGLPRSPDVFIPYTEEFENLADPAPFAHLWALISGEVPGAVSSTA